ncbi:MAG: A24 family peptidase [bacterium]|nr:A24 family peptidase [bacterium]
MIVLITALGAVCGTLTALVTERLPQWKLLPTDQYDEPVQGVVIPLYAVMLAGAASFGLLFTAYGLTAQFALLAGLFMFFLLITLIDLRYRLVLNLMIYPALLLTLTAHVLLGHPILFVLVGGGFALTIFMGAAFISPGGLGMGDVKLALLIGLMLGFPGVLWALIVGVGMGGVLAVGLLLRHRSRSITFPYAPCLCLGAMIALVFNPFLTL